MSAEQARRGPRSDARRNDERILYAAARVLAEDPRATIQRIADEAGVVRLTVYRRYPNRDALRRAIFEVAAEQAEQVIDVIDGEEDPVVALRTLITEMAAIAWRYPLLSVGTDLQPLPTDTRRPVPPPVTRAFHRAVLELVQRGQRQGALRADLPAELLPLAIVGTVRTVHRFARSFGTSLADPTTIGAQIADLLLRGFATAANGADVGAGGR